MDYKLGDKVRFNAEQIRKQSSVVNSSLNLSEAENLKENGILPERYTRYIRHEPKIPQDGIICGVRSIRFKGFSDYIGYDQWYGFKTIEYRKVYLVASKMSGFHRVLPEDILTT